MRLKQHINEKFSPKDWEVLRTLLENDCQPYIKQLRGAKSLLCRGSKKHVSDWSIKSQRQDRVPLLIDINLHHLMDAWTKKNWGFEARSSAAFTTNREHNARNYGYPYRMFPIGDFDYAWNDNVSDLYGEYDSWLYTTNTEQSRLEDDGANPSEYEAEENVFHTNIVPHLQDYKTSGLNKMLSQSGEKQGYAECIVHCKKYYLINHEWASTLLAWFSDRYWRQK